MEIYILLYVVVFAICAIEAYMCTTWDPEQEKEEEEKNNKSK